MKRNHTLVLLIGIIIGASLVLGSCAQPAPSPVPTSSPAPTVAPSPKADPLAAIIEGAKKEGKVLASLTASYTKPENLQALSAGIKAKWGVDLNITATGTENMASDLAKAILEYKTNAVPSYDVMTLGTDFSPQAMKSGAYEVVDWKPLALPGTPPEVILQRPNLLGGLVYYSSLAGLQYNPTKITANEVPKKISDLTDPKWKGRLGVFDYENYLARWAHVLGKDYVVSTLRKIIEVNKPMLDRMPALGSRYMLGEVDLAFTGNTYLEEALRKGVPGAWQNLDYVDVRDFTLLVRNKAEHPNAAKLLSIYLASPEGGKFSIEKVLMGTIYYPGNPSFDTVAAAKKAGVPVWGLENHPTLLAYIQSPDYDKDQAEIKAILDGAKKK